MAVDGQSKKPSAERPLPKKEVTAIEAPQSDPTDETRAWCHVTASFKATINM